MNSDVILDEAIALTAEHWKRAEADGSIPNNLNLRDRVTLFAPMMRALLFARWPQLRAADDQVILLVVAEGIAQSGSIARDKLETSLGIILPPDI
jgi:hypothetical protein